jgi:HPt (histidine-containing phosphotransfer) domain-containing protein
MKHFRKNPLTGGGLEGAMVYQPGAIDAALAAAVGDNPTLVAELRLALVESAERHADLLERARCDANWRAAAWRLKGLAASFGALPLMQAADEAVEAAPGDPVSLRKVKRAIAVLKD